MRAQFGLAATAFVTLCGAMNLQSQTPDGFSTWSHNLHEAPAIQNVEQEEWEHLGALSSYDMYFLSNGNDVCNEVHDPTLSPQSLSESKCNAITEDSLKRHDLSHSDEAPNEQQATAHSLREKYHALTTRIENARKEHAKWWSDTWNWEYHKLRQKREWLSEQSMGRWSPEHEDEERDFEQATQQLSHLLAQQVAIRQIYDTICQEVRELEPLITEQGLALRLGRTKISKERLSSNWMSLKNKSDQLISNYIDFKRKTETQLERAEISDILNEWSDYLEQQLCADEKTIAEDTISACQRIHSLNFYKTQVDMIQSADQKSLEQTQDGWSFLEGTRSGSISSLEHSHTTPTHQTSPTNEDDENTVVDEDWLSDADTLLESSGEEDDGSAKPAYTSAIIQRNKPKPRRRRGDRRRHPSDVSSDDDSTHDAFSDTLSSDDELTYRPEGPLRYSEKRLMW